MRALPAAVLAALIIAGYIGIIYGFFAYVWPNLPSWATLIAFIALAVFAIGSPLLWLLRMGNKTQPPGRDRD